MAKLTSAKSKPVEVSDPVEDCRKWKDTKDEIKELEKTLETLKPHIKALLPEPPENKVRFEGVRDGKPGVYEVSRVTQDRRKLSPEKMMVLLEQKGLVEDGTSLAPDEAKIALLIDAGKINPKELEECLTGVVIEYAQVDFT